MRFALLVLHVSAGTLAMLAGAFAISSRKGSRRHRTAGNMFVICMLTVSAAGAWLAFRKSEADNVLGGIFAFYLVATAWATARRGEAEIWSLDWTNPPVALAVAAIWFVWGIEVTRGRMAVEGQSSAGGYFFFGVLALLCAAGDVRMLLRGGVSGRQRLARHLWRMCFGWFVATISFFLGQQQVFPRWLQGSTVLVVLAFLPLLLLIFWLVRVRFTSRHQGWVQSGPEPSLAAARAEHPRTNGTAGNS